MLVIGELEISNFILLQTLNTLIKDLSEKIQRLKKLIDIDMIELLGEN
jgi:hypothetical protein